MPIDASIYGQYAQPVKSVADIENALTRGDLERSQLVQNQLAVKQAQNVSLQREQLRQAVQSGDIDLADPTHAPRALALAPDVAPAMLKTIQEGQQSGAKAKLDLSQAGHADAQTTSANLDNKAKAAQQLAAQVQNLQSPDDIASFYEQGVKQGLLSKDDALAAIDKVPYNDPQAFATWKQQQVTAAVPVVEKFKQDAEMARTKLQTDTSTANTASNNRAHLAGIGMQQSGENARSALGRQTQLTINGMDANGNYLGFGAGAGAAQPSGQAAQPGATPAGAAPAGAKPVNPMQAMVDAVGQYKIPESTAFSRMPPGVKSQVLGAVMQQYPDYDANQFSTRAAASKAFTTGNQGNALRSFAVAGSHLEQLGKLVDALDNGNMQIVNKVGNYISEQTGNPAPTNFDAAKDVVSKEVVKAIVAGGGGVAERAELADLMSKAKSPAQLKGVITQYSNLMGAQHDALLQQRRAAGLSDSTLPSYSTPGGGSHPPEITDLLKKYGPK